MRWNLVGSAIVILASMSTWAQAQPVPPPESATAAASASAPGYLGLVGEDRLDAGRGVRIVEIAKGSPAEISGLQVGDLIVAIGDETIRRNPDVDAFLQTSTSGQSVSVRFERGGATMARSVILASRPASGGGTDASQAGSMQLGIRTAPLDLEVAHRRGAPIDEGVLVSEVVQGSAAAQAALPVGAMIVSVNGVPVGSPDEFDAVTRQFSDRATVRLTYFIGDRRFASVFTLRPTDDRAAAMDQNELAEAERRIDTLELKIGSLERKIQILERAIIDLSR